MSTSSDTLMPKALTDFVFDLYDTVTLSQLPEEQAKLYETDFKELSSKYFDSQPWPSPRSIASECNGDPLFLALYRELVHRHWHAVSRPTLRDRLEGWQVYKELFEEMLENSVNFYLLPQWTFDILNEFVYQFQGFCQVRAATFASARKHGLLNANGTAQRPDTTTTHQANVLDSLNTLETTKDSWNVQAVFGYLHRLSQIGWPTLNTKPPVYTYLSIFAAVATSRLECLLGDYTACLQALEPLSTHGTDIVEHEDVQTTVHDILSSVMGARISLAYHAGVSLLALRRYKDAIQTLASICSTMQRGFKTGQFRKLTGSDQCNKQYDRMLSLLAILTHICPQPDLEESLLRAIREKHGSKLQTAVSYEEWFASPKFISIDPCQPVYRQQVQRFLQEMDPQPAGRTVRSYLKLYTALSIEKLAHFHDLSVAEFLPLLLSYKFRMRQLERTSPTVPYVAEQEVVWKTALDIHYYVEGDVVYIDEAERPRRFENFFVGQIMQNNEIRKDAQAIDTQVL